VHFEADRSAAENATSGIDLGCRQLRTLKALLAE
jgi:hypothetical protein